MGSDRSKVRPGTKAPEECKPESQLKIDTEQKPGSSGGTEDKPTAEDNTEPATPQRDARNSWYSGSWRTKSTPVTATARELVSVAQGVTSEALEKVKKTTDTPKRPGHNVSQSMRGSRKSIPLMAEPTKVHATSDASSKSKTRHDSEEKLRAMDGAVSESKPAVEEQPKDVPPTINDDTKSVASSMRPQAGSAWLGGWWSRPDGYASDSEKVRESNKRRKLDDSSTAPYVTTPSREIQQSPLDHAGASDGQSPAIQESKSAPTSSIKHGSTRSWFGPWSTNQNEQQEVAKEAIKLDAEGDKTAKTGDPATPVTPAKPDEAQNLQNDAKASAEKADAEDKSRPSGWAFWSYERPKDAVTTPNGTQKQLGEIAVADTPSQSHPEAAQFNEQRQKAKIEKKSSRPPKPPKQELRDEKAVVEDDTTKSPSTPVTKDEVAVPGARGEASTALRKLKGKAIPNVVAPAFTGMYPTASNAGYVERLAKYLAQTLYIPGTSASSANRHVLQKVSGLPKIKKTIAIGVHGFFPAPLLQRVLGPPTGTSIRFANYAAAAISEWCKLNQPEIKQVEIEKVALEGEGFIADRVNTLWKLLLNWLSHLRQADFIMVACHSQGVPVAIMLVAKLIQLGVLSAHAKIGICAMAGINLGPFLEYRSRLFAGSALELFDFCDSTSKVSKSYFESVDICLRHGVRITYVGSLDDQLVSLESSLFMPLQHPYVHRATFIDGRLHSPSFLTHLVIFALRLRNLGMSDHGLIRELSAPLAGSLMGGEGHSRIYDDPAVYRLAIDFALESTDVDPTFFNAAIKSSGEKEKEKQAAFQRRSSVSGFPSSTAAANSMRRGSMSGLSNLPGIGAVIAQYEPLVSGANSNPFYLPWAVRGMLEEDMVKADMGEEVAGLVKEFDEWKPQSKVLKDVKWRLEGVKSML